MAISIENINFALSSNKVQPSLDTLVRIFELLYIEDLIVSNKA